MEPPFKKPELRREPEVLSASQIKALVRQLKGGDLTLVAGEFEQTIQNVLQDPCNQDSFIKVLKLIGKGSFGQVYKVDAKNADTTVSVVIKHIEIDADEFTHYSSFVAERNLTALFYDALVKHNVTLHLPTYIGSAVCAPPGDKTYHGYLIMLEATFGTFDSYISGIPSTEENKPLISDLIRQALFEMTYTFIAIHENFPGFRHNDIKLNNIFVTRVANRAFVTRYKVKDKYFYVPSKHGMRFILGDLGLASIPGLIDNIVPLSFQYQTPEYGISVQNPPGLDLAMFALHIYQKFKNHLTDDFQREMIILWKNSIFPQKFNHAPEYRINPEFYSQIPPPTTVLNRFFKDYETKTSYDAKQKAQNRLLRFEKGILRLYQPFLDIVLKVQIPAFTDAVPAQSIWNELLQPSAELGPLVRINSSEVNKVMNWLTYEVAFMADPPQDWGYVMMKYYLDRSDYTKSKLSTLLTQEKIYLRHLQVLGLFFFTQWPEAKVHWKLNRARVLCGSVLTLQEIDDLLVQLSWLNL